MRFLPTTPAEKWSTYGTMIALFLFLDRVEAEVLSGSAHAV